MDTNDQPLTADLLVVDDQRSLLAEIEGHLAPFFDGIHTLSDPAEALRELRAGARYGVLLFDSIMDPISGLDLLKLVRADDPVTPVLIMTAHASMESAIKALQLGAIDYVLKPIEDWEALARSIKRALIERHLKEENAALFAELSRRNEDLDRACTLLRHLNLTTEHMHASREIKQVLNILVKAATEFLEADRVSIMIRDPKNDQLAIQVAAGIDAAVVKQVRVQALEGIVGRVVAERRAIVVNDTVTDTEVPRAPAPEGRYKGRSFMSIPILLGQNDRAKVIGVVNVTERRNDRPFTDMEVEFISHLARQAAFALMGAALLETRSKAGAGSEAGKTETP